MAAQGDLVEWWQLGAPRERAAQRASATLDLR
jgi:hypothetical protein